MGTARLFEATRTSGVRRPRYRWLSTPRGRQLVVAVLISRLLVLAAAIAGASGSRRVDGWTTVDPLRLSTSFGRVGNAVLGASVRWDSIGYLRIAEHGYTRATDMILFPGYPMAIHAVAWVTGSAVAAGLLISGVSFAVSLWLLHRLADRELGGAAAGAAVLLLTFAPVSFFFTAVYTESLFLALSVGAFAAARDKRWVLACLLAAGASITRLTGVVLVVPIAIMYLRTQRRLGWGLIWTLLPPLALAAFLAYLHGRGYGWFAPFHNQRAHEFDGPLQTIFDAVRRAATGLRATVSGLPPVMPSLTSALSGQFDSVFLLGVLIVAAASLVVAIRRLPLEYGVYAALALLVSIASETKLQPLEGLDRYGLTIFPLWIGVGAWLAERRAVILASAFETVLLCFYTAEFARWAFVA